MLRLSASLRCALAAVTFLARKGRGHRQRPWSSIFADGPRHCATRVAVAAGSDNAGTGRSYGSSASTLADLSGPGTARPAPALRRGSRERNPCPQDARGVRRQPLRWSAATRQCPCLSRGRCVRDCLANGLLGPCWRPFRLAIGSGVASTPKSLTWVLGERRSFQNVAGPRIAEAQHPLARTPHRLDEGFAAKELRHALTHIVNASARNHGSIDRQIVDGRPLAFSLRGEPRRPLASALRH